ncbi:unnamed protein product [Ceratitis capitata]|uniref:(Mediterranean fruit fly) hypothetical protein n=1 Tax=Ceratitis capitata TaxID=7213 RepID=A0A811VJH4_CERCA|nr:unnamed protein product [Ceratitis capitata]
MRFQNIIFSSLSQTTCAGTYIHMFICVYVCSYEYLLTPRTSKGIWTPGTQTPNTSFTNLNDIAQPKVSTPTPPPPPRPSSATAAAGAQTVWTPQPSPSSGRKEFRPVRFESPTLPRRYVLPQNNEQGAQQIPPPWRQSTATTTDGESSYAAPSPRSAYSYTNLSTPTTTIGSAGSTNYCDSIPSESSLLNQVGTGRSQSVADKIKTFERSASTSALYSPAARRRHDTGQPFYKPNEVIFKVKHEYMSEPETEQDRPRKMAQLSRRQVDGIGPVTNDGMPIILRSEVKEPHQHEWYKRLYQTIHKQKSGDDYVIRYKCQRARPQLKSTGYQSEPEPNYDSDYSTVKYRTLDRRRLQSVSSATNVANRNTNTYQDDKLYGTMPNPIKSAQNTYKNQPGRIEDYVTGRSSVSEKERKEWWDEVMDIFNGHLDQAKLSPHYTEGNLSRALAKETGYTSDSNLVFRKRDVPQASPLSPVEQKQAYKSVQAGGEPPLFGFRKPAPERPRETEKLEYTQISPTLTRIRLISTATNSGNTDTNQPPPTPTPQPKHTKVHHQAKMFTHSFIQLDGKRTTNSATSPPQPPNRKSSCQKASSRTSPARPPKPAPVIPKRHEQCFQSPDETVLGANNPTRAQSRVTSTQRPTSRSPVAFGRSISKERTFAEEKKRLENTLPSALTNFEASTNILRDPSLKSPQEVKQAVRSYATCVAHLRSKSMPRLREEVKRTEPASVSTTVRHTMCFPQAKIFDCAKAMRKSLTRSKSPRSKSPRPKAVSTVSLTRTDSTFSIDSVPPKSVSKTNLVVSKKVLPPKSKTERKPIKSKSVTLQNGHRSVAPPKGNTMPKTQKSRSVSKMQTSHPGETHTIPRSGYESYALHQSRSLSPKRYYQLEEYNARLDDYDELDRSYVDDLLWQYEHGAMKRYVAPTVPLESKTRDFARPESPTPSLKHRKFSPTREVRVPKEPRSLQVSYDKLESPQSGTTTGTERRFSPTREVRVPKLPPSLQPTKHRSKSPRTVRDIARPESPAIVDSSRRFSPTREIRVPQQPQSLPQPPPLSKSTSAQLKRETARLESPPKESKVVARKFSPTREVRVPPQHSSRTVRSPSRRRIDTYRASAAKAADKFDASKVIRASSLSSADDRSRRGLYLCGELAHSATSLEHCDRHSPTCRYRNNSERFTELNRFYSTLERVGQLERATSLSSFKPLRKDGEPLDFDEWRKIRYHERAEKELNYLVGKLKHEQRTKDFVFRPKDVEDVKWRHETDFGLHSKEKSVEDLRYAFEQKNIFADYERQLRQEYDGSREFFRPYWRRNTVADLASSLEGKVRPEGVVSHGTAEVETESSLNAS